MVKLLINTKMRHTGKYCPITDGYDFDEKINEVAKLTEKFIKDLKDEVGIVDYQKIAEMIIEEHLKEMNEETFISVQRATKYAKHQHFLGTYKKDFVEFNEWKYNS